MADETGDPRVPILNHERAVYASVPATLADTRVILAKVDAADPLRRALPEIVKALEELEAHHVELNRRAGRREERSHTLKLVRRGLAHARKIEGREHG